MVVGEPNINNIMGGIENTGSVRLHNHRKKLKQRFDIIKKLGQGTYGKVQLGINKETGQEVAIKTIKKSKIETEADLVRIRREIQIMSSVQHPNIIHIYEVFENREKMVLVMEYAAGGELYDYLSERKVLAEEEARRIFRQIATACYYCHKHKICHRDLKLENILLDEQGNAKIADFGLSNVFDDQRLLSTFCGSPLYASPEIVKGTPYQGPEVDCWSLGVLLYTLVYGAMPFDGSNFKRLVRQISQGDYFEPKKPSRGSPLIRDMLTVNPRNRANIEKICSHWWVNEGYDDSCLDISEELANQTPVRLDLLLSLAPPAPQLESEKLVVTGETANDAGINSESALPTRSQSAGSLMDFTNPAERRIKDLLTEDVKVSPKRKLEAAVSTDQINLSRDGLKRKEKIVKENTIADITLHAPIQENASLEDASMSEVAPLNKSATRTLSREMDVEQTEEYVDPSTQGAACTEIIEDAKKNEGKKSTKIKKTPSSTVSNKILEGINEHPSLENVPNNIDKENIKNVHNEKKMEEKLEEKQKQEQSKIPAKRKSIKKKVLTDKNENSGLKSEQAAVLPADKSEKKQPETSEQQKAETEEVPPTKPVERRRSRIFETAEKFQNMISANENKSTPADKPKKLVIPGVSVGGYKKEFERKASLTTPTKSLSKKSSVDNEESTEAVANEKVEASEVVKDEMKPTDTSSVVQKAKIAAPVENQVPVEGERKSQVQNAVNIISSVLDKDGTRKSKSRPCMTRKPPVPLGSSGRSASGSIPTATSPQSPQTPLAQTPSISKEQQASNVHGSTPAQVVEPVKEEIPVENKTSSAEITLKSATLPRRKTTKAEIKLDYPAPKPATMGFKTEMAHHVEVPPKLPTQRSEVTFPVSSPPIGSFRSASVEPESKVKQSPRERIIPISFERDSTEEKKEPVSSPPIKPPTTKSFQSQKSTTSQRSNSLSRQSTQESDSETTTSTGEPIRKSPREYIIPIAVEGGGYVTPRAGSLEPSDTASTTSTMTSKSKFGRNRRLNDREGSEDESPFAALHRHSSFGRDSDTEDPRRDMFRMHSLRSSRPRKAAIEHNDSFSSGEEDDDDGFEILTAENLFSTLLSRVRDLTQRLNVDGRPGFPTSRLLSSHFDHGANFWNLHNRTDPLSRYAPIGRTSSREQSVENSPSSRSLGAGAPWRRSVSRDLATDIESVYNNSIQPPTHTATLPRGDTNTNRENLNLTDLDLKKLKLSDEDALALSYLTPGLSRRIQKQLLAQLAPSEARKLSRTLSMRSTSDNKTSMSAEENKYDRKSIDHAASTLPRRFSVESSPARYQSLINKNNIEPNILERARESSKTPTISDSTSVTDEPVTLSKLNKSFLPVKSSSRDYYSPLKEQTRKYSGLDYQKPLHNQNSDIVINQQVRRLRSPNSVDPKSNYLLPKTDNCSLQSPDSSTSDSLSTNKNDDHSYKNTSSISSNSNFSESSRLSKYLSPTTTKYCETTPRPYTPTLLNTDKNRSSELRGRSPSARRTSRFLRPDFYDTPKDGNYYLKEKKEREMETQKVLKEIRDKRKSRFRERSASRENNKADVENRNLQNNDDTDEGIIENTSAKDNKKLEVTTMTKYNRSICDVEPTDNLLKNVSDNIKNLESSVKVLHDYVNVNSENKPSYTENKKILEYANTQLNQPADKKIPNYVNVGTNNETTPVIKKERASKIARPKSYPTENQEHKEIASFDAGKSKISKLNKAEKVKEGEGEKQSNKNKFLQTIEKKFEKLRSFSNSPTSVSSEETKAREEKKSMVEDTIKRLREQSVPRNMDHCITESGLIKRAVSVEDLSTSDPKQLQASRKSVTKILNLFKKYEEKGPKKNEKGTKTKKSKEESKKTKEDAKKTTRNKHSQLDTEKTERIDSKLIGAVPVISNNNFEKKSDLTIRNSTKNTLKDVNDKQKTKDDIPLAVEENKTAHDKKSERPRSLLLDRTKQFQPTYNGARSDSNISTDKDLKQKGSKLPVTSFRRSLNLENAQLDPPKFYKNPNSKSPGREIQQNIKKDNENNPISESKIADRSSLKLDLKVSHQNSEPTPSTSTAGVCQNTNRNSLATDNSSVFLSPCEDNVSCDSWSVCSDYHTQELTSPVSPCNHFYSADENESVSDRIRRKSFYTRFNEKKRPRKTSLSNYRDLDLYKDMNNRKLNYRSNECSSLDRRSVDLGPSKDRKLCYSAVAPEPLKSNGKGYAGSNTAAFLNDGYVNVPNRYQTCNPRITTHSSSVYDPDSEEASTLDDVSAAGKNRMYSYDNQPSRYSNRPFSPSGQLPVATIPSSENQTTVHSSASQNHV